MPLTLVYTFDPQKWRLGSLCKHGHRWPGTGFSLRRTYVSPKGVPISSCAGCKGGSRHPQDWLIKFIDNAASGVPEGKQLGTLCPKGHDWQRTGYTLRRKSKCIECEKEKRMNTPKEVLKVRAHAHYLKNKDKYKAKAKTQYEKEKENGRWHQRRVASRDSIVEWRRQQRIKNGAVPRELVALHAHLNHLKPSPCVAELVALQERQARVEFSLYWLEIDREQKKHCWRLRYLTDERLRLYTRSKSKARKAKIKGNAIEHLTLQDIAAHFNAFGRHCAYCGDAEADLHIEHFYPISKGGAHCRSNIVPACPSCNYSKFNHDPFWWYRQQPFFCQERLDKICSFLNHGATKQD